MTPRARLVAAGLLAAAALPWILGVHALVVHNRTGETVRVWVGMTGPAPPPKTRVLAPDTSTLLIFLRRLGGKEATFGLEVTANDSVLRAHCGYLDSRPTMHSATVFRVDGRLDTDCGGSVSPYAPPRMSLGPE